MVQQHRIYVLQFDKGEPDQQELSCKVSPPKGAGRRIMYYYHDYGSSGGGGGKNGKPAKSRTLSLRGFFGLLLICFCCFVTLLAAPGDFFSFGRIGDAAEAAAAATQQQQQSAPCSGVVGNDTLCCDRTSERANRKQRRKVALVPPRQEQRPRLTIVSRATTTSRVIENEAELKAMATDVGFEVRVVQPQRDSEMCKIYGELNGSDAMVGVHGAAMTHFLFMRPGKVFIQVVPLGMDWAANEYYGAPARRLGLRYVEYKIRAEESSLAREYPAGDPVLTDPEAVSKRGWQVTKKVYLDRQNVRLDLARFRAQLVEAHRYIVASNAGSGNGKRKRRPRSKAAVI